MSIRTIRIACDLSHEVALNLHAFYSITGWDTTFYLAGHTKEGALTMFLQNVNELNCLEIEPLTLEIELRCEFFFRKRFKVHKVTAIDEARVIQERFRSASSTTNQWCTQIAYSAKPLANIYLDECHYCSTRSSYLLLRNMDGSL